MRRHILLASLLAASFLTSRAAAQQKQPNVLFIAVDDLNHWVGYLGRNAQTATPNIDRLAKRGVRFTRAYCAAPSCTPSRAALMSGRRPGSTGVYDNHNNTWSTIVPPEQCIPAQFRAGGYVTLAAGKIYHGGPGRPNEYDEMFEYGGGGPDHPPGLGKLPPGADRGVGGIRFAPLDCDDKDLQDYRVADWSIAQLGKKHDKPFFLACGLYKPHMPWNVPKKWYDKFPLESIQLPPVIENDLADVPPAGVKMAKPNGDHARMLETGRWKEAVRGYLAAIAYTDMNVGRLLDALDASPHKDNTIIVFWGDHGWHLGEKQHWRKFALWEEATRVPLIWVAPGLTTPDAPCERSVDLMSIYPTLMDLCGLPTPAHVEGKSIRPLLKDSKSAWDTPSVTTFLFNNHAVRDDGWRYIRYADGSEELYDHAADPLEHTNLAAKPEHAARKQELAKSIPTKNAPDVGGKKRAAPRTNDADANE
ncbi:MAG: sulfatase [Planctomycetota bacterium]|nr:sulfatase [Planctomycetota bacterium]